MDEMYEGLKFLHVLAAVVWVGGAVSVQIMALMAQKSPDTGRMVAFTSDAEKLGQRVFFPTSMILLIVGIIMVVKEDFLAFGDTWIVIGLGGFLFSAVTGAAFLGPESGRLAKLIEAKGPEDSEVRARIQRIFLISRIELVVLIVVIWAMVTKPGA